jgi:hypothetical protein
MHTDPKRDAQKTEDAGFMSVPQEAPSVTNPPVVNPALESVRTPPQGPVRPPTPSKQDRLDLERSSGEGMVAPESNP